MTSEDKQIRHFLELVDKTGIVLASSLKEIMHLSLRSAGKVGSKKYLTHKCCSVSRVCSFCEVL